MMINLRYKPLTVIARCFLRAKRDVRNGHALLIALSALLIATGLTACNSSTDPQDIIVPRASDNLRLIQDGDYMEFTVTGTLTDHTLDRDPTFNNINLTGNTFCTPKIVESEQPFSGTLRIEWSANAPLAEPLIGAGTVDVMKQTTTLSLDINTPVTTTEYISQDATTGSISLHAFDNDPTLSQYYWVSTASKEQTTTDGGGTTTTETVADLENIVSPVILTSPLPASGTSDAVYYVNQGCDASSAACAESIRRYTNNLTFIGEQAGGLRTALGNYNPLGYLYRGALQDTNSSSVSAMLDMRGFCNTQESFFSGVAWVLPEVGLLELNNACVSNSLQDVDMTDTAVVNPPPDTCTVDPDNSTVTEVLIKQWNFTAKISATNIPLPTY